jgi:hypothetical protein
MESTIDDSAEGKRVIDAGGEEVGLITEVRGTTAFVDPDPGLTDALLSKLGWGSAGEEAFPIQTEQVESITEDEVRLRDL